MDGLRWLTGQPLFLKHRIWRHGQLDRLCAFAAIELGVTGVLVAIFGRNNDLFLLILLVGIGLMVGAIAKAVIFANQAAKAANVTE